MLKVERWNLIIQSIDLIDTTNVNGCNRNYHILDDQKCSLNFDCSKNKNKKVVVWLIDLFICFKVSKGPHWWLCDSSSPN